MKRREAFLLVVAAAAVSGFDAGVTTVEPADLAKRPELVGREIATDDRVRLFQYHKNAGYDELYLKRTAVVFRLPKRLRPDSPPRNRVVGVRGILVREGDRVVCDVTALEPLPDDLDRLNQGVAALTPRDFETRLRWAYWAERRAKDFDDKPLGDRARTVEAEAIRIEADRPSNDPGETLVALAERARRRGVPEPEPSALAHRGYRGLIAKATSPQACAELRTRIAAFFPDAPRAVTAPVDLARWEAPYANDPAAAYRLAPPDARKALDRRLWADAAERTLTAQAEADPTQSLRLAETAESELPDRPQVAARLLETGLKAASADPLKLRQAEVERLARFYREKLHDPQRAQTLLREWLDVRRRKSLRPTDAEGRINLAAQYDALVNDRATALSLLREAYKIDPASKELTEAFLVRGCKKGSNGEWVEPRAQAARDPDDATGTEPDALRRAEPDRKLRGATEEEVRSRLGGRPNRVARTATQGQAIEQWIYYNSNQILYVNFIRSPGDSHPRVTAFYSRRRTAADPPSQP